MLDNTSNVYFPLMRPSTVRKLLLSQPIYSKLFSSN